MYYIDLIIGTPLGYIMYLCYHLIGNYGWTIVLFTLVIKLLTLPIGILVQKNSIKMVKMQPLIADLKRRYPDKADKDAFMEAQMALFKEEKYSPGIGCLPMFIQIPIIMGLFCVIYNPLRHLFHLGRETIGALEEVTMGVLGVDQLGVSGALMVVDTVQDPAYTSMYQVGGGFPESTIDQILSLDTFFFGMNLSEIPTLNSILILIPLFATISAFLLCVLQNKENVLQLEQGRLNRWGTTIFLTAFSMYFTTVVPAGVGLYWIFSNLFAIAQLYILNAIYDPKKYIDYEYLNQSKETGAQLKKIKKEQQAELKKYRPRERADYKRFLAAEGKQLVFYSERSGFYKYFENVIDEILKKSDIQIHYVTSDPNDAIFRKNEPQITPYYIGEHKLITLMMKMDADMVVMTMPDLNQYHIKRSYVRKGIEYVFMPHWMTSVSMVVRRGALDHFDTVFCVGPHWVQEIREMERLYGLPEKTLLECGYGVIENLTGMYRAMEAGGGASGAGASEAGGQPGKPQILIAPSWQDDNILDCCIDGLLGALLPEGYHIIVRPHPEYIKRYPGKIQGFLDRYEDRLGEDFILQTDFSSNTTVFESDLVITDWSTIAQEFSYATRKPTLFIDTPMKIMNPEYDRLSTPPLDITLRTALGRALKPEEMEKASGVVAGLLADKEKYREAIDGIVEKYIFHFGRSGQIGARYIMKRLEAEQLQKGRADGQELLD